MSMSEWHEHTVGEFEWDGVTYQIDWPFELDDETTRCDFGAIYADEVQVGEVCAPFGRQFETADDVMEIAIEAIMSGDVESGEA